MLEEHFTYQNAEKELLNKHTKIVAIARSNYGNHDVKLGSRSQQKISSRQWQTVYLQ